MRYPWHSAQWRQTQQRREAGRLPHALLLVGPAGLGKFEFARQLAQSLLCGEVANNGAPCGQCKACLRFAAGSHPDLLLMEPEETGKAIKVAQIRELIGQFALASHQGGYRIAIIHPADSMNPAAANSLLKTLEEPPANTLMMLISDRPSLLPATILSRCQRLEFAVPARDQAQSWLASQPDIESAQIPGLLALSAGAPLAAKQLAQEKILPQRQGLFESFLVIAAGQTALSQLDLWLKPVMPAPINWLSSWINDLIRLKSGLADGVQNADLLEGLQNLHQKVDLQGLFVFLDELYNIIRLQRSPLNASMLMEGVLLQWQTLSQAKAKHKRGV